MRLEDFKKAATGELIQNNYGGYSFVPAPLPPELPASWELTNALSRADRALSELAGIARNLPNPHLLIGPFTRQEAVLSSRIEGTQTTLSELLLFEEAEFDPAPTTERQRNDALEVRNYVHALEFGQAQSIDRPISLGLLKQMHELLMKNVRGSEKSPGQFRQDQNFIGPEGSAITTATYVPPPPLQMRDALLMLESYINTPCGLPPLIRHALIHYQFEAIHPFMDGNGRIGRLLLVLLMRRDNLLPAPLLYLSGYFERNRSKYYEHLLSVSQAGTWTEWIAFFLQGVTEQAQEAARRSDQLLALWARYRKALQENRAPALSFQLVDELFAIPVVSVMRFANRAERAPNAVQHNVERLIEAGILQEMTGRARNRIYIAPQIVAIVEGRVSDAPEEMLS